jgi:UDP-N-acetylmuramate dehydrogenase
MQYTYRSSMLKRETSRAVILDARFKLHPSTSQEVHARIEEYTVHRRRTQPPGASLGSMFKNPAGDYAGRLIEAAGLKGARSGSVMISPVHANFFVSEENATAADIAHLIELARRTVADRFGVLLELEIELLGDWKEDSLASQDR